MTRTHNIILAVILLLALGLRLAVAWTESPLAPYDRDAGGDEWWYLEYGFRQVVDEHMEPLASAPLYLLFVGSVRYTFQPERVEKADRHVIPAPPEGGLRLKSVPGAPSPMTVRVVQVIQALLSTASVYFVYRVSWRLADDPRAGLVAAAVTATSVALIVTAVDVMTETLYIFFLVAGIDAYIEWVVGAIGGQRPMVMGALVGALFGLATLTRAVALLFPLGILFHAILVMLVDWRRGERSPLVGRGVAVMLAVYIAVCSTWTVYYYQRWGEVVIGAKGLTAFFYFGASDGWQGPAAEDEALGAVWTDPVDDDDFSAEGQAVVSSDPLGWLTRRTQDLAGAYAQPYGTVSFPGESIRAGAESWWRGDRSLAGLVGLLQTDGFAPKLVIYLAHYGGIMLGLIGVVLSVGRWRASLVVVGFIAYVTLLHLVLLALPRYLFPTLPLWWALGGV
ncbi:MAG: hypothetical protein AAF125_17025, partial [Chloroflexota bacterium]